jgi:hypothetical protein
MADAGRCSHFRMEINGYGIHEGMISTTDPRTIRNAPATFKRVIFSFKKKNEKTMVQT